MNQIEDYKDLNAVAGDLIEGIEIEGLEKLSDTNLDDLDGIIDDMEGLGDLGRSKKKRARKAIRKAQVNKAARKSASSNTQTPSAMNYTKNVYASQMKQLPADIQKQFASKEAQLVDFRYYSTKVVEGSTYVRMFDLGDNDTVEGISNTPNGKVPAGEYFSVRGIRLVAGEAASADLAGAQAADYNNVAPAIVMNGEMTFGIGNVNFFEKMPVSITDTRQNTNGKVGEYIRNAFPDKCKYE